MMLKDVNWPEKRSYRTGKEHEPFEFYLDGLTHSSELHLLLGYFSSAAINLLSTGFASFISKGGKLRMVINQFLSAKDKKAIEMAESVNADYRVFDLNDVVSLEKVLDEYDKQFFECIAYLIKEKRIEIKIIRPKAGNGIAHYKSGVFSDGKDYVGFESSCNFTLYGLSENLEGLRAFLEWEDNTSKIQIEEQLQMINDYFKEVDEDVNYLSAKEIEVAIRETYGGKDINELLVQEEQLVKKKVKLIQRPKFKKKMQSIVNEIKMKNRLPRFPYLDGPREYQEEAYRNWVANNYKGIFAMATGTGKTITSLNCLLKEYNKFQTYRAVIIVPTIALVQQWKKECSLFNFKNVITVSSKENWDNNLAFFNTASKLINTCYIVIVTYASLPKAKFQSYFKQLPSDTVLIADETHNLGSKGILRLLPSIHLEKRIGLSATPNRKFDEFGNETIENFFNDKHPYIVSFSMEDALNKRWLCRYKYFPHIVKLTEREMNEYRKISLELYRLGLFDKKTGKFKSTPEIERKLLERKRIIHKAEKKIEALKTISENEFNQKKSLKFTLVYVPEGKETGFDEVDFSSETNEEVKLIDKYTKVIRDTDDSIMVRRFMAKTKDRDLLLKEFETGQVHVLTSMKCLDEGVDVPRSELAIFCASTGNPRQFIQRRGRVLRLHNEKNHATIHDLVVVPEIDSLSDNFDMEKNLVKKELERVVDFARLATNKSDTYETFKEILDYYNLNLNDL